MLCKAGVLGLLASWLGPFSVWVELSLLPVFEWPVVIGVEGSTGDGEDEIDSVLRDSVRNSGPSRTPCRTTTHNHSRRTVPAGALLA